MKYSAIPTRHTFPRTRFPLSSSADLYLVFFSLSDGPIDGDVSHLGTARIAEIFAMRQSTARFDSRCRALCHSSRRHDCLATVEELAVNRAHGWRRHREDRVRFLSPTHDLASARTTHPKSNTRSLSR